MTELTEDGLLRIRTITMGDEDFEVLFDATRDKFHIRREDSDERIGYGDSVELAVTSARQNLAKNKIKVKVPFITYSGRKGYATGLHATTGKSLVRIPSARGIEKAEQWEGMEQRVFKLDIPENKLKEYQHLTKKIAEFKSQMQLIESDYGIYLPIAIRAEIARELAK